MKRRYPIVLAGLLGTAAALSAFAQNGNPAQTAKQATPAFVPVTDQVLAKQTTDVVPDLSEARPDVSDALSAVLARALRNEVEARWASAGEFRSAIEEAAQQGLRRRGGELARLAARILGT